MPSRCKTFAAWSRGHAGALAPVVSRDSANRHPEPSRLQSACFRDSRSGGLGLFRDLHDPWLLVQEAQITWEVLHQASSALRGEEMERICRERRFANHRQGAWLRTRIDQSAPQALAVP